MIDPAILEAAEKIKEQIPSDKDPKKIVDFSKRLIQISLEAFHLTSEMVDLSESESKALDHYFYANLLMVQCKNAAVRVSRSTWSEIKSRMLLPTRSI